LEGFAAEEQTATTEAKAVAKLIPFRCPRRAALPRR
jgi:hypothetical protein